MKTITAGTSKQGLREYHQDAFIRACIDDISILAVADGNGGTGGGELAKTAVKAAISWLTIELAPGKYKDILFEDKLRGLGLGAIKEATEQVLEAKKANQSWASAGTTLTLVLLTPSFMGTFWVGDSPCYLFSSGRVNIMTEPVHTLAEQLIQQGQSKEAIYRQPSLNSILTRCLGHNNCQPDEKIIEIEDPSIVLVGSDGVFGYVSKEEIEQIIKKHFAMYFDIQQLSDSIVQKALNNGSDDNCTITLALTMVDTKIKKTLVRITRTINWRD